MDAIMRYSKRKEQVRSGLDRRIPGINRLHRAKSYG